MPNLKLAFRTLFRTPFVTIVAVLSLALGIGANAGIFSLFNEFLLQSLPVQAPHELVNLSAPGPKPGSTSCNQAGDCEAVFSYPMFRDLEEHQTPFAGLAAHRSFGTNLAYEGQTSSEQGAYVSGSYFPLLGVLPEAGRLIGPGDDSAPGEAPIVVLAHAYWTRLLNADPSVLNQTLVVNGQAMTIVGITPEAFNGTTLGSMPAVYVPITVRSRLESFDAFDNRRNYWVYVFGRLKPSLSLEQAGAELNGYYRSVINEVEAPLQTGMSEATLALFNAKEILLEAGGRGQSSMHREASTPLLFLMIVTGGVLFIACANVANLLLARSASRAGEMAVRLSIGAGRRHLIGQLLTEAGLLAVLGGLAAVLVAQLTLNFIASMLPAEATEVFAFTLDGTALAFLAAVTVATGLLFGLLPALHASRPDLASILKSQAGQPSGAKSAAFFRKALATIQIVLAMTLLGGAGLFIKSLVNVSRVDLGLNDVDNVITFRVSPQMNGYSPERTRAFYVRLEEELAALPGVTSVSASLVPLLDGSSWGNSVTVQGYPTGPDVDRSSRYNEAGPNYLRTLGIPLMSGREFTPSDTDGAPQVALVNETFAAKFDLGRAAVGKRMNRGGSDDDLDIEIVGLMQDAKYADVKTEVPPLFVVPYRQQNRSATMSLYVRTALDPDQVIGTIQPLVARLDPNLPVNALRTMPEQVRENVFLDRLMSTLAAAFASLATLLAAVGLYGVLAYTVSMRTREFGLRMALGADPGRVRRLVMRQVAWMTAIGSVLGLGAAIGIGRLAQSILFELEGYDPVALASSFGILVVVALTAGFIPAFRASRVDPMRALRQE
jgi:predicted permease